jgi:predicted regulator of Ras-like GTPase activity (Roadblock/LC7/MglB family)
MNQLDRIVSTSGAAPLSFGEIIKSICDQALKSSTEYTENLLSAVIATTDGFEVASIQTKAQQVSKISAMISTMQALGGALALESGLNGCDNIVMETHDGILVMRNIPSNHNLVLCFIASNGATVGHLNWCSRQCAKIISERLPPISR